MKVSNQIKNSLPKGSKVVALGKVDRTEREGKQGGHKFNTRVVYSLNGETYSTIMKGDLGKWRR